MDILIFIALQIGDILVVLHGRIGEEYCVGILVILPQ
jgi:hypothetical protein